MNGNRILAVSPGTREIGIAVFADSELLYYGVKTIRMRKTSDDLCAAAAGIIRQFIAAYQPHAVALIRPLVIQPGGQRLVPVIREVKRSAQDGGVRVYEYAPKTVWQFLCGSQRATRQEAARMIAALYPELAEYAEGRTVWEEVYYARMFGAVAVGLADCYSRASGSLLRPNRFMLNASGACRPVQNRINNQQNARREKITKDH